jgi:hypothetical protein
MQGETVTLLYHGDALWGPVCHNCLAAKPAHVALRVEKHAYRLRMLTGESLMTPAISRLAQRWHELATRLAGLEAWPLPPK